MTQKRDTKFRDSRKVLLQDSILSVLASLLALLLVRWLTEAQPGFTLIVAKWLGCALGASLVGFFLTNCYRYVRRFATVRSLGKVAVAITVKELLLCGVLLLKLIPSMTLPMAAPDSIALQVGHSPQGLPSLGFSQLTALARIFATEVFPVPLVPQNRYACPILSDLI